MGVKLRVGEAYHPCLDKLTNTYIQNSADKIALMIKDHPIFLFSSLTSDMPYKPEQVITMSSIVTRSPNSLFLNNRYLSPKLNPLIAGVRIAVPRSIFQDFMLVDYNKDSFLELLI